MFNLKQECEDMFGTCVSFYEAIEILNAQYNTQVKCLPEKERLASLFDKILEYDEVELLCNAVEDWRFKSTDRADWTAAYKEFLENNEPEDEVKVTLIVTKNTKKSISVYCFEKMECFFVEKTTRGVMRLFVDLIDKNGYVRFNVFDKKVDLFTKTIAFTNVDTVLPMEDFDRGKALKCCDMASLFLNRNEVTLLPQDFKVLYDNHNNENEIKKIFARIETILDYVYIANTAYITDDKLVVQFDPTGKAFDFALDNVPFKPIWNQIYEWVFETENAVERAAIARNVIAIDCKSVSQLEDVSEETLRSIKSNYVIYQKNLIEKYIDVKKSIADSIVETSKQIQEMTHELTEGLRNNFVAVIMFLITVILTDSVDWDDLIYGGIPEDIVNISYIFDIASLFYLIITLVGVLRKWDYCRKEYFQLKANYEEILEKNDLDRAFKNDMLIKRAEKRIIEDIIIVGRIWGAFLIIMFVFFTEMKYDAAKVPMILAKQLSEKLLLNSFMVGDFTL